MVAGRVSGRCALGGSDVGQANQRLDADRLDSYFHCGMSRSNPGKIPGEIPRSSRSVRAAVLRVYEEIGGDEAMARWARENPDAFYSIVARMLPKEQHIEHSGELVVKWLDDSDPDPV